MLFDRRQQGFTILTLLFVLVLIAGIYFAVSFVIRANQDTQKQAGLVDQSVGKGDQDSGDPDELEIPDAPSTARNKPINKVEVHKETLHTGLQATLPGTYSGTCVAEVSQASGAEYRRYVEAFKAADVCMITIPNERLKTSKDWKFKMSYYTSDGRYRGSYAEQPLGL